ncbi:unnamed protein product [Moneuplotes crassus]|uniref:Uncharacterized protein n=1 Tax=Euplotes crassus TaxID=5936 RepID=A0AAD1U591_EUPCR|nr:unnamed protein product [Moneuplotes crassus]
MERRMDRMYDAGQSRYPTHSVRDQSNITCPPLSPTSSNALQKKNRILKQMDYNKDLAKLLEMKQKQNKFQKYLEETNKLSTQGNLQLGQGGSFDVYKAKINSTDKLIDERMKDYTKKVLKPSLNKSKANLLTQERSIREYNEKIQKDEVKKYQSKVTLQQRANSELMQQIDDNRKRKAIHQRMVDNEKEMVRAHFIREDTKNALLFGNTQKGQAYKDILDQQILHDKKIKEFDVNISGITSLNLPSNTERNSSYSMSKKNGSMGNLLSQRIPSTLKNVGINSLNKSNFK